MLKYFNHKNAIGENWDIQDPNGKGFRQFVLASPAWAEDLAKVILRGPFQPKWFCESGGQWHYHSSTNVSATAEF